MGQRKDFEIAIVGGGIAGITLAIALQQRNVPVKIYEQAPKFGEIGAGVSFSPNAVQAMKYCNPGVYDAFEKVCTGNVWPSKQKVWFDFFDGYTGKTSNTSHEEPAFTISNDLGQNAVHRATFLDEMVKLVPHDIAIFGKKLEDVVEGHNGKMVMKFDDGSTAEADAVIGCDGIKSRVRHTIVGKDHPSLHPVYTHKYAYRGLIPMEEAIKVIGEEKALNACCHMGPGGHLLSFAVSGGKVLNVVAFKTNPDDWPDFNKLTRSARREDALRDFEGYDRNVIELLKLTKENLDVWAIFDTGDHPLPTFYKGRIAVSGDAAHATTPHHGAGAGFCLEDSAIMAALLADKDVNSSKDIESAFAAFDACRRERTQWLVQSSRFIGDLYEWRAKGVGKDFVKIEKEIRERNGIITNIDIGQMCEEARVKLREFLAGSGSKL